MRTECRGCHHYLFKASAHTPRVALKERSKRWLERSRPYAPVVTRLAVSAVFLWFGISQITNTANYLGYLPDAIFRSPYASAFVVGNGAFELALGGLLALGILTRIVALLLGAHLLVIASGLGYGDVAVRDIGLALATLSVCLHGNDKWCVKVNA